MRIAVEGCTHGELDKIYSTLQELEEKQGYKVCSWFILSLMKTL